MMGKREFGMELLRIAMATSLQELVLIVILILRETISHVTLLPPIQDKR